MIVPHVRQMKQVGFIFSKIILPFPYLTTLYKKIEQFACNGNY